jgi:hypothetical protein
MTMQTDANREQVDRARGLFRAALCEAPTDSDPVELLLGEHTRDYLVARLYEETGGRWCRAGDEDDGQLHTLCCHVCGGVPEDSPGPWMYFGDTWRCARSECAAIARSEGPAESLTDADARRIVDAHRCGEDC